MVLVLPRSLRRDHLPWPAVATLVRGIHCIHRTDFTPRSQGTGVGRMVKLTVKPVTSKSPETHCWHRLFMGVSLAGLIWVGFLSKSSRNRQYSSLGIPSVVKATMASNSSASSSSTLLARHRILCYGDSLTAGTSGMSTYPYGPYLEAMLTNVDVKWIGLPGWTADNMFRNRDNEKIGLRATLQRYSQQHPSNEYARYPVSLVILLAGTNDLGFGFDAEEISDNLYKMHETCYESDVPHTIAVAIPPSAYQIMDESAAQLVKAVNENLRAYCAKHPDRTTFVDFPFGYERGGANWYSDGLHFSERGYQVLGEYLAPTVSHLLKSSEG